MVQAFEKLKVVGDVPTGEFTVVEQSRGVQPSAPRMRLGGLSRGRPLASSRWPSVTLAVGTPVKIAIGIGSGR